MDLRYSDDDEAFRAEVRAWLEGDVPSHGPPPPPGDWPPVGPTTPAGSASSTTPATPGLAWPVESGGRGAPITQQLVYLEEYARAGAPYVGVNFVGMMHAGPTLIAEGTDEQRALPPPADPARRGRVVPGLLRARGRLRPRLAAHPRRARRRRLRRERARRSGARAPRSPTTASCWCAPTRTPPKHKGITLADPRHALARHRGAAAADHRRRRATSARCSSTRCGSRSPTASATRTTAGGSPT